jgi:hypothetical protein
MATKKKIDAGVKLLVSEPKTEKTTWTLTLVQEDDGVSVNAVSSHDNWSLVKFRNDGTFHRYDFISSDSGFAVDLMGRITESEEEH